MSQFTENLLTNEIQGIENLIDFDNDNKKNNNEIVI